ncbi:hypothetical protein LNQ81_08505 [Myroides sp. M-43]|uniref:WD40 repeat domain-containing protein n=1 Tax=Myroides oncorhynchi TaxID=2893756 RepID=UPI001E57AEBD|nr:hypothetical protein [Myroides oncorhynchi]MCC9042725.1 hypothetical protein [Myroides oncorhynchi]
MKKAKFIEYSTDKQCVLSLDKTTLITENINNGKSRTTEKTMSNDEAGLKEYDKKRFATLKKGYVELNDKPKKGEAFMHYYVGGGYTGCLSFTKVADAFYIYKCVEDNVDVIMCVDKAGRVIREDISVAKRLVWDMEYISSSNEILLDLDHHIYLYNVDTGEFTKVLESPKRASNSVLTILNNQIAFGSGKQLKVWSRQKEDVFVRELTLADYHHNTPFSIALTGDGKLLAIHTKVGEIEVIEISTGEVVQIIKGGFEIVKQMRFVEDGTTLAIREMYGDWALYFYSVTTGEMIEKKGLQIVNHVRSHQVDAFCFNEDESLLVQKNMTTAYVFDYRKEKLLYSFELEHCVKSAELKIIEEQLAVRTDYGCFSLYRV